MVIVPQSIVEPVITVEKINNPLVNTQTLATKRGKRICFLRFVESWKERNDAIGIVVLECFIELPRNHFNQYVFASFDLEQAMLHVYSEHEGCLTEIRKTRFPYNA